MALDTQSIIDAVASHAAASGWFEQVNQHEPVSSPGNGLTAAVWTDDLSAVRTSGLASASGLLVVYERLYTPMVQEPMDAIDPQLMGAVDALFAAYIGDFTLGGLVRQLDIFGQHGIPLLKIATLTDSELIHKTQLAVKKLVSRDPTLTHFPLLREKLKQSKIEAIQD